MISGHGGDLYLFSSRGTLFFGGRAGKIRKRAKFCIEPRGYIMLTIVSDPADFGNSVSIYVRETAIVSDPADFGNSVSIHMSEKLLV